MSPAEIVLSVGLGIALAAAAGFRIFVPLLVAGLAARYGHLELSPGFGWLASPSTLMLLGAATVAELLAYAIPAIDNLMDVIAAPAALVAGVVVAAAVMVELPPAIKWTAAIIAGGSAAGLTQGLTTLLRAKSTAFTAGLGNPVVSGAELVGAGSLSVLALAAPLLAALLALAVMVALVMLLRRLRVRRNPRTA